MEVGARAADETGVTTPPAPVGDRPRSGATAGPAQAWRISALPNTGERLLPWLGAAVVMACVNLLAVLVGLSLTVYEWAALLLTLGATLSAAGLVAARSRRAVEATERDERSRPAHEQILAMGGSAREEPDTLAYVGGMERWTTALLEVLDHALEHAPDAPTAGALSSGADDTRALNDLLRASAARELNLNESAMLHSVCSLWETDQDRLEALAAAVDPGWHRRWRARSVVAWRLRHGRPEVGQLVLPYRS